MKNLLLRLALVPLVAVGLVMNARADGPIDVKDTIKKTFKVRDGGTLVVDVDRGNIEVRLGESGSVFVEIERKVGVESRDDAKEIFDHHELDIVQSGNDVSIRSRFDRDKAAWLVWRDKDRFRLKAVVHVPRTYNVNFSSGAGNVRVESIEGYLEGRTGAGNIMVSEIRGEVDLTTGSGNISVEGVRGDAKIVTGAGNVSVGEIHGAIQATTGAGNISAKIAGQPGTDSSLDSGAGNVTVYLSEDVSVEVRAISKVGSCSNDFDLVTGGKWMKKWFKGEINGGGPELAMSSGVGNVTLLRM